MCSCAAFNEPSSSTETDHPAPASCWSALRPLLSVQFSVQPCPCLIGSLDPLSPVSGSGFPLPWYLTFTHYTGLDGPPCGLSPDLTTYWRTFAFFSFLFDTIFYAGLAMSRNEIYAWFKGSGLQSPRESPCESQGKRLENG